MLWLPARASAWPLTGDAEGDEHWRQDLDIGADGDVWSVGLGAGGAADARGMVYRWVRGHWETTGAFGTRVAVDPQGGAWHINEAYQIYRPVGSGWVRAPGSAREIDVGPNGEVWILGTNWRVYRWTGSGWAYNGELGERITVDASGNPWVVKSDGSVRRYTGSAWVEVSSGGTVDVDAGDNGVVYRLGVLGILWRWDVSHWEIDDTGPLQEGIRLAIGPTGAPSFITDNHLVLSHFAQEVYGELSCSAMERDCNVCAPDVERQFRERFDGTDPVSWDGYSFGISWYEDLPPESVPPHEPFNSVDFWYHHWQGFVRTGHPTVPFAGTSSDDDTGAVFTVAGSFNPVSPSLEMDTIHMACAGCGDGGGPAGPEWHPSGAHALGHWVVFEDEARLRFLDLDRRLVSGIHQMETLATVPGYGDARGAGGGLGVARLPPAADGQPRYLVMTTAPGDSDPTEPNRTYVWVLTGALTSAVEGLVQQYLGSSTYQPHRDWVPLPPGWPMDPRYSENLSVITECETGRLYTIHASGPELGDGYYRLSRVVPGVSGPALQALDIGWHANRLAACFNRSAATAYVSDFGILDFYCSEYDAEIFADGDFEAALGYFGSCNYQCGAAPTRSGCFCDAACTSYGDCCADKVAVCGAN